jgi:hypothetical protein
VAGGGFRTVSVLKTSLVHGLSGRQERSEIVSVNGLETGLKPDGMGLKPSSFTVEGIPKPSDPKSARQPCATVPGGNTMRDRTNPPTIATDTTATNRRRALTATLVAAAVAVAVLAASVLTPAASARTSTASKATSGSTEVAATAYRFTPAGDEQPSPVEGRLLVTSDFDTATGTYTALVETGDGTLVAVVAPDDGLAPWLQTCTWRHFDSYDDYIETFGLYDLGNGRSNLQWVAFECDRLPAHLAGAGLPRVDSHVAGWALDDLPPDWVLAWLVGR